MHSASEHELYVQSKECKRPSARNAVSSLFLQRLEAKDATGVDKKSAEKWQARKMKMDCCSGMPGGGVLSNFSTIARQEIKRSQLGENKTRLSEKFVSVSPLAFVMTTCSFLFQLVCGLGQFYSRMARHV